MPWTATDISDQTGRTIMVTGASSGLGAATTIALATRGAHVILAIRSTERSRELMDRVWQRSPNASLEHLPLDLADLDHVETAAGLWDLSEHLTGVTADLPRSQT